jgi:crotonobetainyl-CoA:carnitine CoA-transferase CaiB-like acyl-CoA transferase
VAPPAAIRVTGLLVCRRGVTAPFASLLLADMGAQVVKIEEPKRGDPLRGWGVRGDVLQPQSNKQSITLDLRVDEGRDIALVLARQILASLGYDGGAIAKLRTKGAI